MDLGGYIPENIWMPTFAFLIIFIVLFYCYMEGKHFRYIRECEARIWLALEDKLKEIGGD